MYSCSFASSSCMVMFPVAYSSMWHIVYRRSPSSNSLG